MTEQNNPLTPADDGFVQYFAEKLWSWIPEIYRTEDGLADDPDILRTVVEVIAEEVAEARRRSDRLWEDPFVEHADDWAVPLIGELVGTRLLNSLNRRGRRTDVARTIFYRRRKGTPLVLETLIRDIAGWEGVVVEGFRTLARSRHGLDDEPTSHLGFVTGTAPGGWAKLGSARVSKLLGGPFDETHRTHDIRQLRGERGRHGIGKLAFHIYRLRPFAMLGVTPHHLGADRYTFDPSGRDLQLFAPSRRPGVEEWRKASEWELPAPLCCRLLGAASYEVTEEDLATLAAPPILAGGGLLNELRRYLGQRIETFPRLVELLMSLDHGDDVFPVALHILRELLTADSPRANLLPQGSGLNAVAVSDSGVVVPAEQTIVGNLDSNALVVLPPTLTIDPARGHFRFDAPPVGEVSVPLHHYGFSGDIGAGPYERRRCLVAGADILDSGSSAGPVLVTLPTIGDHELGDSKTYHIDADLDDIETLTLKASNGQRPYVLRRTVTSPPEWTLRAKLKVDPETEKRTLTVDGLWLGLRDETVTPLIGSCPPMPSTLALDGVWDEVVLRHCTLDPGGEQMPGSPPDCIPIPYVTLEIRGTVEKLVIESSIMGPIRVAPGGALLELEARDSIIHSPDLPDTPALDLASGQAKLERVTVYGDVDVERLWASETLIQGTVVVTDTQRGCFRFSSANPAGSVFPRRFEARLLEGGVENHFFVSRRFGDPGYAQLSESAPVEIARGAENGSELGAFSSLLNPIKLADLEAKVLELMPAGLIPQFIFQT